VLLVCCLSTLLSTTFSMDIGRSGVYGSPMANDYYVKRFGFMFGGGWSGMKGLEALQESIDPMHISHHQLSPILRNHRAHGVREKKMVKLSPIKVDMKKQNKQMVFNRFMAVP